MLVSLLLASVGGLIAGRWRGTPPAGWWRLSAATEMSRARANLPAPRRGRRPHGLSPGDETERRRHGRPTDQV